jgi:hypothetical protein
VKFTTRVPSAPLRYYVGLQSKRRRLVMLYLVYPLVACIGLVAYSFAPVTVFDAKGSLIINSAYFIAIICVVVATLGIWVWSYLALMENWSWVTMAVNNVLDERLIAKKNEALARSFRILALIVPVEMVFYSVRSIFDADHQAQIAWLLFCLIVPQIPSIPAAVIAWTEPDGPESDDVADGVLVTTAGA